MATELELANAATMAYNAGKISTQEWLSATRDLFLLSVDEQLAILGVHIAHRLGKNGA